MAFTPPNRSYREETQFTWELIVELGTDKLTKMVLIRILLQFKGTVTQRFEYVSDHALTRGVSYKQIQHHSISSPFPALTCT